MGLDISQINAELDKIENLDDQSVAVTTGGNFTPKRIPIGRHPIRLVSYVELGVQEGGMYEGKQKPDEDQVRMVFEFLGKRTVEKNDDDKEFAPRRTVTKKRSMHTKAGFYKLFQQMRAGDSNITHMAQMVGGSAWLVTVKWRTKGEDGQYIDIKKKDIEFYEERLKNAKTEQEKKDFRIFDNIDWSTLGAPVMPILDEDGEDTGDTKPLKVRDHISELQVFLWDNPSPAFWDSIHIDGTYTKKVDDKEVEVSKNFIQETIMGAKNYEGSPIQNMLDGLDDLPGKAGAEPKKEKKKPEPKDEVLDDEIPFDEDEGSADKDEPVDEPDEMDELGL